MDGTLGWTISRAVPILDAAGNIVEWFGTARDITEQKRAENALRDIRSRMEAALAAAAIGTWTWEVQPDRFFGDESLGDPDGRGHAALERLGGHHAYPRAGVGGRYTIIFALTGWGQVGDKEQSRDAGCDGHLVKPVSLPDLQKLLAELQGKEGR